MVKKLIETTIKTSLTWFDISLVPTWAVCRKFVGLPIIERSIRRRCKLNFINKQNTIIVKIKKNTKYRLGTIGPNTAAKALNPQFAHFGNWFFFCLFSLTSLNKGTSLTTFLNVMWGDVLVVKWQQSLWKAIELLVGHK